ncbi:MAG: hypothetical protein EHM23_08460 [Acidobacteria bacterium]|nr:MAG: hypothetical protein EHM23_08460 [Acidobacteriota bacterium]
MTNDRFIIGVNYPWRHYGQDFGTCAWGHRGLASAVDELRRDFEEIRTRLSEGASKPVIRVFVFADGRASPEFDASSLVTGFDDYFFRDFDSLVDTSSRSDLLVMPVLLDFRWCYPRSVVDGVCLGGHSDTIVEAGRRASFLERALAPLLERYAKIPEIFAWDLINEPEWILPRRRPWMRGRVSVDLASFQAFVRDAAAMIHQQATQPVTLGSARPQWLRYWQGLGLDLYQCHWYQASWRLRVAASRVGIHRLDRPCLVGEAPTAGTRVSPADYVEKARREGYSGILFWSYRAEDRASDFGKV